MTTARGSEKEPTKGELSEAAIVAQNAAALRALILAIAALSAALGAASPRCVRAQVFGGLTTAALAAEGEGGFFLLAGNDAFRTGALGRFAAGDWVDIGVQLGVTIGGVLLRANVSPKANKIEGRVPPRVLFMSKIRVLIGIARIVFDSETG